MEKSPKIESEIKKEYLTEEERLVKEIEQLSGLDSTKKIELILVWRKLKPATEINLKLKEWRPGGRPPQLPLGEEKTQVEKLKSIIKSLGLYFEMGEKERAEPRTIYTKNDKELKIEGYDSEIFYIASNQEDAKKLAGAWQEGDRQSTELGHLFGFPESSIKAYEEYKQKSFQEESMLMREKDLPSDIQEKDYMAFAQFRLSKDNWKRELETAKKWAEEIKKVSPRLYKERIRRKN